MQAFKLYFTDLFMNGEEPEIERNLKTLFSTREGSQPADRSFGINWSCLDELPEMAESLFFQEATEKVRKYEPRAVIGDITCQWEEGSMIPLIRFKRKEL